MSASMDDPNRGGGVEASRYIAGTCPGCRRGLRIRECYLGLPIYCNHCGHGFLAGSDGGTSGDVPAQVLDPSATDESRRSSELEEELRVARAELESRSSELEEERQRRRDLERRIAGNEATNAALNRELQEVGERRDRDADEIRKLRTRTDQLDREAAAREAAEAASTEWANVAAGRLKDLDAAREELANALAANEEYERSLSLVRAELTELRASLDARTSEQEALGARLAAAEDTVGVLRPQLKEQIAKNASTQGRLAATESERARLERALEDAKAAGEAMKGRFEQALAASAAELRGVRQQAERERKALIDEGERRVAEVEAAWQSKLREARGEIEQLRVESERHRAAGSRGRALLDAIRSTVAALRERAEASESRNEQLSRSLEETRGRLETSESERERLESLLSTSGERLEARDSECDALRAAAVADRGEMGRRQAELAARTDELNRVRGERDDALNREGELTRRIARLEQELEEIRRVVRRGREANEALAGRMEAERASAASLTAEVTRCHRVIEYLYNRASAGAAEAPRSQPATGPGRDAPDSSARPFTPAESGRQAPARLDARDGPAEAEADVVLLPPSDEDRLAERDRKAVDLHARIARSLMDSGVPLTPPEGPRRGRWRRGRRARPDEAV